MMILTRLKLAVVVLLALAMGPGDRTALSYQSPGGNREDAPVPKTEARKETKPAAEAPSGQPDQHPTDLPGRFRAELDFLSAQLRRKQAELEKAIAQREQALAVVAMNERGIHRPPGRISMEEILKAETDVKLAHAQKELAQIDVEEAEHRLAQAKLLEGDPKRMREYLDRWSASDPLALDRRLKDVERKLDQIMKALDLANPVNPVGDSGPTKTPR